MRNILDMIDFYGDSVDDFEVSAFESIDMLHRRTLLHSLYLKMTPAEKIKLFNYDLILIKNAKKMSEHISEKYNFSLSNEPTDQWWWHLDKVASGKLIVDLET